MFPRTVHRLRKIQGQLQNQAQERCHTFALTTPRRVPLPLLPKVKAELQRIVKLGVIEKIAPQNGVQAW